MNAPDQNRALRSIAATIAAIPTIALHPAFAEDATVYQQQLADRRNEYVTWVADNFGKLEPTMDPRDGRRWALNHARLVLDREVGQASRYFESFAPPSGDSDIYFIRFLRTLLDFRDSPRLSEEAKARLRQVLAAWPHNDLTAVAHWPPRHTENHDLMNLTIGLFAQQERGEDLAGQVRELKRFLVHRMERGFVEWNSKCYQYHSSNPLIILADYAPDEDLRRGAQVLLNVMLMERALLGVNGYLGGPSFRCRTADVDHSLTDRKVAYLMDARYDGFLPTVWLAFGMGEPRFDFATARVPDLEPATIYIASGNEPRLKQDEGMFFACSSFCPHPVVRALAAESRTRQSLVYQGQRYLGWPDDSLWGTQKWMPGAVYYFNTPHVSMGSVHSDGGILQSRYNSVLFGADPSQGLRVEMILPGVPPHKRRYEARGRVVQHRNWLLGQGTLFEDGGIAARQVGRWNVYRVGKGLCAHVELGDSYHVLQVSDLDTFADEEAFVGALSLPRRAGDRVEGVALNGDRVSVDLADMSLAINGTPRPHPPSMLHDCEPAKSEYGSGRITVQTAAGTVTFDADSFRPEPPALPALPPGAARWGDGTAFDSTTKVAHTRAMGGLSPRDRDMVLLSASVLVPHNAGGSVRLAVYAGGSLEHGPHAGDHAKLLYEFGPTPEGESGWLTLKHPGDGVLVPANAVLWLAWKGAAGTASIAYQEHRDPGSDFQATRGRWDSKAIAVDAGTPWPAEWPDDADGSFDPYWYSCFLTLGQLP